MDKKQDRNSVSQKILETTRETEKLKQELQSLIAAGLRGGTSSILTTSRQYEPLESTNKVQILKSFDPDHSQHVKREMGKPSTSFQPIDDIPPRKQKTYNVDEAREYLQNQRKKRAQELRSQKADTKVSNDLKKEKLKELQEKANEIVRKNIQAKRSRSKSREPPIVRSRSATVQNSPSKSKKPMEERTRYNSASKKQNLDVQREMKKAASLSNINTEGRSLENVKSPHLLAVSEVKYGEYTTTFQEDLAAKSFLMPTRQSPESLLETSKHSTQLTVPSSSKKCARSLEASLPSKRIVILENVLLKHSGDLPNLKEPETSKITPHWLKEQPQADPYNFINTIKRRCELDYGVATVNKPSVVDIGIQNNIDAYQNSKSSSSRPEVKSFKSHQHLNVDSKHVNHVELALFKDGPTMTRVSHYSSENDSDTSKNIPSIFNESCTSLASSINRKQTDNVFGITSLEKPPPNLDAEKIEDIKLKISQEVSSHYSDFPDSSKATPRDSIISFNKSKRSPSSPISVQLKLDKERKSRKIFESGTEEPGDKGLSATPEGVVTEMGDRKSRGTLQGAIPKSGSSARSKSRSVKTSLRHRSAEDTESITEKLSIPEEINRAFSTDSYHPLSLLVQSKTDSVQDSSSSSSRTELQSFKSHLHLNLDSNHVTSAFLDSNKPTSRDSIISFNKSKRSPSSPILVPLNLYKERKPQTIFDLRSEGPAQEELSVSSEVVVTDLDDGRSRGVLQEAIPKSSSSALSKSVKSSSRKYTAQETDDISEKFSIPEVINTAYSTDSYQPSSLFDSIILLKPKTSYRSKEQVDLFKSKSQTVLPQPKPKEMVGSKSESDVPNRRTRREKTNSRQLLMQNITLRSSDSSKRGSGDNVLHSKFEAEIHLLTDLNQTIHRFSEIEQTFKSLRGDNASLLDKRTAPNNAPPYIPTIVVTNSQLPSEPNEVESSVDRSIEIAGAQFPKFDQLIIDEDSRIENWRKVLKIREQFLLDRTRGELQFLELQRKQLIETGKLAEASMIKKKQRGILLKHQEERNEMQRLKQMQKEESLKRKTVLSNKPNSFKKELMSSKMLAKLKLGGREQNERRLSGPFKVIQVNSSSGTDHEFKSITPRSSRTKSIISAVAEESDHLNTYLETCDWNLKRRPNISADAVSGMQKNLLMREHALAQRRKTVEELLKWHKRLMHEEKLIEDLESRVCKIITQISIQGNEETSDKVSGDETTASSMSQVALEHVVADQEVVHSRVASSINYTADFEVETTSHKSDDQSSVSSINQLIEDLSKIQDNILNSSIIQTRTPSSVDDADTESLSQILASANKSIKDADPKISGESLSKTSEAERVASDEKSIQEDVEGTSSTVCSDSGENVISFASVKEKATEIEDVKGLNVSTQDIIDDEIYTSEEQAISSKSSKEMVAELESGHAGEEIETTADPLNIPEMASTSTVVALENIAATSLSESISQVPLDITISNAVLSAKSTASGSGVSKEEISTSKLGEEIDDLDFNQPSTSRQDTVALLLDSNNDVSEDDDDTSSSSIHNDIQSEPLMQEDRQLFESKTDEEKAVFLSGKSSGSSRAKTKLATPEEVSTSTREEQSLLTDSGECGNIVSIKGRFSIASGSGDKALESPTLSGESASEIDVASLKRSYSEEAGTSAESVSEVTSEASSVQSKITEASIEEKKPFSLGTEAEELHRKQLAIEQEIKLLKEQQQKEAASPFYIREIPNKPPPPYTPPSKAKVPKTPSVTPGNKDEVEQITEYSAKIIHKAYLLNNLDTITISDNTLNLIAKNIDKGCYKYVFDICKEIAIDHYGPFLAEAGPSWLQPEKKPVLSSTRPLDVNGLKELMNEKLLEMFGLKNRDTRRENAIMKSSRKKRDHVDEVLVQNMHSEESTWTNFDKSDALVKDHLTNEMLQMLVAETAEAITRAIRKKVVEETE